MSSASPIGIFDSGVGGLSVLRHIRAQLPHEHLLYFADSACAPYGDKSEAVLVERALAIAGFLVAQGAKALVVACNTATVAAIAALRAHYPAMPLVGVEPGLKPAAAATRNGMVGVLATEGTLAGAKFLLLREQISAASSAQFLLQGCPGLADQIESGEHDSAATVAMLERFILPLLAQGADTLVLGCTHYPFVQDAIAAIVARAGVGGQTGVNAKAGVSASASTGAAAGLGGPADAVVLIDTGDAVARHLARLLAAAGLLNETSGATGLLHDAGGAAARLDGYASANAPALALAFTRLLGVTAPVMEVPLASPAAAIAAVRI